MKIPKQVWGCLVVLLVIGGVVCALIVAGRIIRTKNVAAAEEECALAIRLAEGSLPDYGAAFRVLREYLDRQLKPEYRNRATEKLNEIRRVIYERFVFFWSEAVSGKVQAHDLEALSCYLVNHAEKFSELGLDKFEHCMSVPDRHWKDFGLRHGWLPVVGLAGRAELTVESTKLLLDHVEYYPEEVQYVLEDTPRGPSLSRMRVVVRLLLRQGEESLEIAKAELDDPPLPTKVMVPVAGSHSPKSLGYRPTAVRDAEASVERWKEETFDSIKTPLCPKSMTPLQRRLAQDLRWFVDGESQKATRDLDVMRRRYPDSEEGRFAEHVLNGED